MPPACWGWAQGRLSPAWWPRALSLPAELGGMCQVSLNVRLTLGSCCALPAATACSTHAGLWCGAAFGACRHPRCCSVGNQSWESPPLLFTSGLCLLRGSLCDFGGSAQGVECHMPPVRGRRGASSPKLKLDAKPHVLMLCSLMGYAASPQIS